MAIETVFRDLVWTHGVVPITCWDGKHFFIKDLQSAKLSNKTKKLEDIKILFESLYGDVVFEKAAGEADSIWDS